MAALTIGGLLAGAAAGTFAFIQSLINHPVMAYFFILAGLSVTTGIQNVTGFGLISFIISNVVSGLSGLTGFVITDFQILIIFAVIYPLVAIAIKKSKPM